MLEGLLAALSPTTLGGTIAGVIIGIIFGAIPGLTVTLAVALFVPVTFLMSPENGMIMLSGIYVGGVFGGSISAILVNVPGTPSSIVTGWEGHALAKDGKASLALSIAALASGLGGLLSAVALMFLTPLLAAFTLKFGAPEYTALLLFSFVIVIAMSEAPLMRSVLACAIGLLLVTIGLDPLTGNARFTFGSIGLLSGFNLLAILIGFYCMPQAISLAFDQLGKTEEAAVDFGKGTEYSELLTIMFSRTASWVRASVIGVFLGILPAVGPVTTPFIAHAAEKRFSGRKEPFGKGSVTGLIAAEASNNANVGGSLIPLISLGIPGSGAAAVFIGALTLHGLQPGPLLFTNEPVLVYTFFWGFVAVNLFMMVFGLFGARYFAVVLKMPKRVLASLIAAFSILGAYATGSNMFDVGVMLGATALAIWLRVLRIPLLPIVLTVILGPMFEQQAVILLTTSTGVMEILQRPIAVLFFVITLAVLAMAIHSRTRPDPDSSQAGGRPVWRE